MTRLGIIVRLYGIHVEPRPFSRFTKDEEERAANQRWMQRATVWGATRVDAHGHFEGSL